MKRLIPFLLLLSLAIIGCRQNDTSLELKKLRTELAKTKAALAASTKALSTSAFQEEFPLVHVVYFKTKKDANLDEFIKQISQLKGIPELKNLEVGTFKNLGDQRAMSDYGVVIQMNFANEAAYQLYQKHPLHLQLKEKAGAFLAAPPITYDYEIKK